MFKKMKRQRPAVLENIIFIIPIMAYWLIFLSPLTASEFQSDENVYISRSEVIEDDLYVFGNMAEIYGKIDGDLSAFCFSIESNSEVFGNANLFSYKSDVGGVIEKSARIFGYDVYINSNIGRNLLVLGNGVTIGQESHIGRDLTCIGDRIEIDGIVDGNLDIRGRMVEISGTIEGDVNIEADEVSLLYPAMIKGNLYYKSPSEATVDDDVFIIGETEWDRQVPKEIPSVGIPPFLGFIVRFVLFIMALSTGFVIILLFKRHAREASVQIERHFLYTFAIGCLSLVVATAGSFLLFIFVIGIPLSLLTGFLGLVFIYIGKIYVSIWLGRLLFRLFNKGKKFAIGWEFLLGLVVLSLLFQISYLGWIIYLAVSYTHLRAHET